MEERVKGPLGRREKEKKKKEDLRPLIYIRFNSYHRIEKKKGGGNWRPNILGKQRTN